MNTLSKGHTRAFFENEDGYVNLVRRWGTLVNSGAELRGAHYLLYLALRGRDWRRAFGPLTNPVKLANGGLGDWGLLKALRCIHSPHGEAALLAPFAGTVTPAALAQVRALLPKNPARLTTAYTVPEVAVAA